MAQPCTRQDLGLLVLRLGVGGILCAHGTQKLFGWFGGGGLDGTAVAMEQMGFRPGRRSAVAAGLSEAGSGALLALGLATPAAAAVAGGAMATASSVSAPAGFFVQAGGYEYTAFLGFTAVALGLSGPGRFSVDHCTGHVLDRPWVAAAAFTLSALTAAGLIARRVVIRTHPPQPVPEHNGEVGP